MTGLFRCVGLGLGISNNITSKILRKGTFVRTGTCCFGRVVTPQATASSQPIHSIFARKAFSTFSTRAKNVPSAKIMNNSKILALMLVAGISTIAVVSTQELNIFDGLETFEFLSNTSQSALVDKLFADPETRGQLAIFFGENARTTAGFLKIEYALNNLFKSGKFSKTDLAHFSVEVMDHALGLKGILEKPKNVDAVEKTDLLEVLYRYLKMAPDDAKGGVTEIFLKELMERNLRSSSLIPTNLGKQLWKLSKVLSITERESLLPIDLIKSNPELFRAFCRRDQPAYLIDLIASETSVLPPVIKHDIPVFEMLCNVANSPQLTIGCKSRLLWSLYIYPDDKTIDFHKTFHLLFCGLSNRHLKEIVRAANELPSWKILMNFIVRSSLVTKDSRNQDVLHVNIFYFLLSNIPTERSHELIKHWIGQAASEIEQHPQENLIDDAWMDKCQIFQNFLLCSHVPYHKFVAASLLEEFRKKDLKLESNEKMQKLVPAFIKLLVRKGHDHTGVLKFLMDNMSKDEYAILIDQLNKDLAFRTRYMKAAFPVPESKI